MSYFIGIIFKSLRKNVSNFRGNPLVECPLSGAVDLPELFKGQLCHVTKATEIEKESFCVRISMS
ncbi:unnamed protein product, partial [Rotaria magnacalcarata]